MARKYETVFGMDGILEHFSRNGEWDLIDIEGKHVEKLTLTIIRYEVSIEPYNRNKKEVERRRQTQNVPAVKYKRVYQN